MARTYNNGIFLSTGFRIEHPTPVDDRYVVQLITDLSTLPYKYDGLKTYVQENETTYRYRLLDNTWLVDAPTAQEVFEAGRTVNLINGGAIGLQQTGALGFTSSLQLDGDGTTQFAGNQVEIFGIAGLNLQNQDGITVPTINVTQNITTNINGVFADTTGTIDITGVIGLQEVLNTNPLAESIDGFSVINLQPNYFIDGGTQNPFIYFKMSNDDESIYTEYSQNHDGLNIYRYNNVTGLQEYIDFDQFNPMIYMEATDAINGGGSNLGIHQQDGIYGGYSDGVGINNQFKVTPDGFELRAQAGGSIVGSQTNKLTIGGAANGVSIQGQGGDVEIQGNSGGIYVSGNLGFTQLNGKHTINTASDNVTFELGGGTFIINPITASNFAGIQYAHDNSANYVPLSLITKQDLDNAVAASYRPAGNWDASGGTFPTVGTGSGGVVRAGDVYRVSVAGTIAGEIYDVGDTFYAVVNAPGQISSNWGKFEVNTSQATDSYRGTMFLYTGTGANTNGTITQAAITNALILKADLASPTFTGTPLAPTAIPGTNTTQIATTAFVTTAIVNKITQGGDSFGVPLVIGSNDNQNVSIERNNVVRATFTSSSIDLADNTTIQNATSTRGMLFMGSVSTGPFITRNTADAVDALQIINQSNTSTGNIATFYSTIGSLALRAGVRKDGRVFGSDAILTNDYVTLNQTTGFLRLGPDTVQTPHRQSFMTEAQYAALVSPDLVDTVYFIEELIPTKIVDLNTNASSYPLVNLSKLIYITFTGTTSTFTLPAVAGGKSVRFYIFNQGTGTITVNSNTGGNDIWDGGPTGLNTYSILSGNNGCFYNNGTYHTVVAA